MTQEEKVKAYDEALDKARKLADGTIKDIMIETPEEVCEFLFPELNESKDEKIRKYIIDFVSLSDNPRKEEMLAYLERQKEQKLVECIEFDNEFQNQVSHILASVLNKEYGYDKGFVEYAAQSLLGYAKKEHQPAEWSEEFLRLMGITISQDGNQVCVLLGENLAEGIAGFGDTLADAVGEFSKDWRQFDRFRKATWKPSNAQLMALHSVIDDESDTIGNEQLKSLYDDLKKLL